MIEFKESKFYKLLQDFFINNDKETFIQFLAEFYNKTEGIVIKNDMQDEIIKELREMYIKFNEEGIDDNIVREKVNYFIENSEKIQDIITKLITTTNNIKNINSQLEDIMNIDTIIGSNKMYLIPTYGGKFGTSTKNNLELYLMKNFDEIYTINNDPIFTSNTGRPQYDYCGIYRDNMFILFTDYKSCNATTWGGDSLGIIKTQDFKTYDEQEIIFDKATLNITQTWAPEYFEDTNGDIYLLISAQINNEKYIRADGKEVDKLAPYYIKALNDDLTSWGSPRPLKINNSDVDSRIDGTIVEKDGVYHLFIKSENKGKIEHYTSSSLSGNFEYYGCIDTLVTTEAPCIITYNDKYYMLSDSWMVDNNGLYLVFESEDLYNWTFYKELINNSKMRMRHFTPIEVNENNLGKVKSIIKEFQKNNSAVSNSLVGLSKHINKNRFINQCLSFVSNSDTIEHFKPFANSNYYTHSSNPFPHITINSFDVSHLNLGDEFSLIALGDFSSITIKNNDVFNTPQSLDFTIGKESINNMTLIKFKVDVNNQLRVVNNISYKALENKINTLIKKNNDEVNKVNAIRGIIVDDTNLSVNSDYKKIIFNITEDTNVTDSNSTFTIKNEGRFIVNLNLKLEATGDTPAHVEVSLYKNNIEEQQLIDTIIQSRIKNQFSTFYIVPCLAGDTLEIRYRVSDPVKINGGRTYDRLTIYKL